MTGVKYSTLLLRSDERFDVAHYLQLSKTCFPLENIDFTPPLIFAFIFPVHNFLLSCYYLQMQ